MSISGLRTKSPSILVICCSLDAERRDGPMDTPLSSDVSDDEDLDGGDAFDFQVRHGAAGGGRVFSSLLAVLVQKVGTGCQVRRSGSRAGSKARRALAARDRCWLVRSCPTRAHPGAVLAAWQEDAYDRPNQAKSPITKEDVLRGLDPQVSSSRARTPVPPVSVCVRLSADLSGRGALCVLPGASITPICAPGSTSLACSCSREHKYCIIMLPGAQILHTHAPGSTNTA